MQKVSFDLGGVIHIAGTWPKKKTADMAGAWFSSGMWLIYPMFVLGRWVWGPPAVGGGVLSLRAGGGPQDGGTGASPSGIG